MSILDRFELKGKTVLLCGLLLSGITYAQNNDWENPQLYEVNKEKPHVTFMLFSDKKNVAGDDYSKSPFYQSLNGTWKFVYADKYADRIKDFYRADLNDSKWNNIPVPSNWEREGFGIPSIPTLRILIPKILRSLGRIIRSERTANNLPFRQAGMEEKLFCSSDQSPVVHLFL